MDTVFYSQITRNFSQQQNNLYNLLNITPANPVTPVNSSTEYECNFRPQNNKVYILKKRSKLKVKTVRDIRACFEKDILYDLPKELDKQQNVLLRKIRSGSIQDVKTKTAAKNIFNSDMPVTRQSWQMLMNINPEDRAHSSQFVLWNGICIQVNGSRGGKNKFLCNRDLSKFSTITSKESKNKLKNKIFPKKKNLLRNSLAIHFKPGPLTQKKYLDASYQKYNVGNIELVNLPKLGLEVMPTYGTNLDCSISNLITNFREVDGIISPKWAEFAVSMVGSVTGPYINQINENCKTTFYLDYRHNQQRTLMRRNVENEIRQYPVTTQASNFSDDSNTFLPEIKVMLDKILDAVEIHIDENKFYTGSEEPRMILDNTSLVPNLMTKEKSKKKYCELDRLDVKVINLSENPNTNKKTECRNSFCTLGCICNSLQCLFNFKNHCGRVECMFKCDCDFSKYNAVDTKESDCSEFLPGLLNLDNINYNLSKEEQKFQQTVIVTDDRSILLKSKRRNWKSSTKYADFYSNMCLKSDLKKEKSISVIDIKLNLENVEPWCMVHCLYKCFCKGKFVDNITNEKPVNEIEKHIDVSMEPKELNINGEFDSDKNYDPHTRVSKNRCNTETDNENCINDDVTFVAYSKPDSSCARIKAFKERNYSNKYYSKIHNKIKELESNDSFLKNRLTSIINPDTKLNVDDRIKTKSGIHYDVSNSDLKTTTVLTDNKHMHRQTEVISFVDNTCSVTTSAQPEMKWSENDSDVESQLKLTEVNSMCSTPTKEQEVDANTSKISELKIFDILRNKPILNRPQLVAWVESGFKQYKKRLEIGKQFVLDPPRKGKITLYAWDFILSRYSKRKNLFLVSKQAPYRIFIAIHKFTSLSLHCINIDEIRFAELNKYPVLVKNLLTNNKGPKDNFCLLYGLSHCWELVSSVIKTKNNSNDTQELETDCSQDSLDTSGEQPANHSDDSSLDKDFINERSSSASFEDHKKKDSSKWFVMTIENDFSEIQFYNHNFFVKYESIMQSIEVARKTSKTVRLSPKRNVDKNNVPQFGIYAVPATQDFCVFIGPYEPDENLGIETIKTSVSAKNNKRTRGVWVSTSKVDNIKLVDNPLSFIPLDKVKCNKMLPIINDSTEPLEQSVNSDLDSHPSTSSESKEIIPEMSNKKTVKVIKISKRNKPVRVISDPVFWNTSQKFSTFKNLSKAMVPMFSVLRKNTNAAPIIVSSDSKHSSLLPTNLPPLDELPIIIDTGTGDLGTNHAQLTPMQPKLKPVAEVAPQIKISAIYSAADFDNQTNAPRSETSMLILKPEQINERLNVKKLCTVPNAKPKSGGSSDHNNTMDIEDFLDSALACGGDDEAYLISDDESEKIKDVFIKCKNIQQIGMLRGRINNEGDVSFEFPGFKYTDFYKKDTAFNKITQVLSRKVCIPKSLTLEWQIVDSIEDKTNQVLKAEDLGSNVVLTKKGFVHKKSLLKTYEKKPAEADVTSVTVAVDNDEQTDTDEVNSKMCEEIADSTINVDDIVLSKMKVYKDAIVKSIADNNVEKNEPTDVICRPCWQRAERTFHRRIREARQDDDVLPDEPIQQQSRNHPTMTLAGFVRTPNSTVHCIFEHCQNITRLRIPNDIIICMIGRYNLLIPENARVCEEHLAQNLWYTLPLQDNLIEDFTASEIVNALTIMRNHITTDVLNFETYEVINTNEFHTWTGLTHEQFSDLLVNTSSLNNNRQKKTILAAVLAKLRTGDSNARLALVFRTSESRFQRMLALGRDALLRDFVPLHVGFDHINREQVAQRNLLVPETLFGNPESPLPQRNAIIIVDGTYIYNQKSSNYFFQRQTYSLHKYRNLTKPFLFVCCDGHIIDVTGPHAASTSDATIMNAIIENEESIFHWVFRPGDVFILDRGFRDAAYPLQSHGYTVHMPETKNANETQLTTEQANKSRLVTICRWVVEIINGRFKRDFRLLRIVHSNRALHHMMEYFKISAALLNAYHVLIVDNVRAPMYLEIIRERVNVPITLADLVNRYNYNRRRAPFRSINVDALEVQFPTLTQEDLILFALGVYQIKQARSYYAEHLQPNGMFIVELGDQLPTEHIRELEGTDLYVLRGKIQSRHVRSRSYNVYIGIDRALEGRQAIKHYYCTCNIGRRTIGCCSHVMCIVWYMGFARHEPTIHIPAEGLEDIIVRPGEL